MGTWTPLQILVIEDDPDTRANLRDILELDGYDVKTASTAAEALGFPDWGRIDVIILDWKLPDGSAESLLPQLRRLAPEAATIISTGAVGLSGAVVALRHGAFDYILKPIDVATLRASLARVQERQTLTRAKARSEAVFRSLVEAAPCMILILRPDRTIHYFSPFAEEVTGYRAEEVVGHGFVDRLFSPGVRPTVAARLARVLEGQPVRGLEAPLLCRDQTQRWVVWNAQHLPDYEGEAAILAVGQDLTTFKEAQEKTLQGERLAAIGQMVTGLAHESGNALARSQACLEMLALEVEDRPEALELIARIQRAQDHLQRLYEEVRGYAAPLKLQREEWDLRSVWRQAWNNLSAQRQGRQATIAEETAGIDLHLPIDPFRLDQVFRNMFENSLAACADPVEIHIRCERGILGGDDAVSVSIHDNGPGLSAEQKRRIFDPFFTTKTKGTGLGMAIAKRIVEAHGGQIEIGPAEKGAELVITLPRQG